MKNKNFVLLCLPFLFACGPAVNAVFEKSEVQEETVRIELERIERLAEENEESKNNKKENQLEKKPSWLLFKESNLDAEDFIQGSSLSLGQRHACILLNEEVYCFGDNSLLQLGEIEVRSKRDLVRVRGIPSKVQSIDSGKNHSCALSDGFMYCWGDNQFGQSSSQSFRAHKIQGLNRVTQMSLGDEFSCAIQNGEVYCFGRNDYSQLGFSDFASLKGYESFPHAVALPKRAVDVSAGKNFVCALLENTEVYCWGGDTKISFPISVYRAEKLIKNREQLCLTKASKVYCSRLSEKEFKPLIESPDSSRQVQISLGQVCSAKEKEVLCSRNLDQKKILVPGVIQEFKGDDQRGCVLVGGQKLHCWEDGKVLRLKRELKRRKTLVSGLFHTCSAENGSVYCWGGNNRGQLGSGNFVEQFSPKQVNLPDALELNDLSLSAGSQSTCLKSSAGTYCWGFNNWGELGLSQSHRLVSTPTKINESYLRQALIGGELSCFIKKNQIFCMGKSLNKKSDKPIVVHQAKEELDHLSVGYSHLCWTENRKLQCLGFLGDKTREKRKVSQLKEDLIQISSGSFHVCELYSKELICSRAGKKLNKTLVTEAIEVQSQGNQVCVLSVNGGLSCFDTLKGLSPISYQDQVDEAQNVKEFSVGAFHVCAKFKSQTRCFGANQSGQLGVGK